MTEYTSTPAWSKWDDLQKQFDELEAYIVSLELERARLAVRVAELEKGKDVAAKAEILWRQRVEALELEIHTLYARLAKYQGAVDG